MKSLTPRIHGEPSWPIRMRVRIGSRPHFDPPQPSARLGKTKMREIDRQGVFRKLRVQPIQEFQIEQGIECEPFSCDAIFRQNLCVDKPGVFGFTDETSLREGAAQSARERRFAIKHAARQLSVDDGIGKDEATTWF